MNENERRIFNLERRLIGLHFKGLCPRPIRLVAGVDFDGQSGEPSLLINRRLLAKGWDHTD